MSIDDLINVLQVCTMAVMFALGYLGGLWT